MRSLLLLTFTAWAAAGCADRAVLRPEAPLAAERGSPSKVEISGEGVVLGASYTEWVDDPGNLRVEASPLQVLIRNTSTEPIEIRYEHFALVDLRGKTHAALPPAALSAGNTLHLAQVRYPLISQRAFHVAPYMLRAYPSLTAWTGPFPLNLDYYRTYTHRWPYPLPTHDMVQRALPEGVLLPGGEVAGYLYFEHVDPDAANNAVLRFDVKSTSDVEQRASLELLVDVVDAAG